GARPHCPQITHRTYLRHVPDTTPRHMGETTPVHKSCHFPTMLLAARVIRAQQWSRLSQLAAARGPGTSQKTKLSSRGAAPRGGSAVLNSARLATSPPDLT